MNNGLAGDKILITPENLCWTSAAAENQNLSKFMTRKSLFSFC